MTGATLKVPESAHGARLDHVLTLLLPGLSLRERRRLWAECVVRVDGTARSKGFRVSTGQTVSVMRQTLWRPPEFKAEDWPEVQIVQKQGAYAALFKPAGLHTAVVHQSSHPSLEQGLPLFFAEPGARLLNRLDQLTSGLVLAALDPEGENKYLSLQQSGLVRKYYLAVCRGRIEEETSVRQRIDSAGKKKVRVTRKEDPDPLRRTRIKPMAYAAGQDVSLVQVLILKGVRHQIRAHLAWLGHPLAGDPLYDPQAGGTVRLFHYCIQFPGFACALKPEANFFKEVDL